MRLPNFAAHQQMNLIVLITSSIAGGSDKGD